MMKRESSQAVVDFFAEGLMGSQCWESSSWSMPFWELLAAFRREDPGAMRRSNNLLVPQCIRYTQYSDLSVAFICPISNDSNDLMILRHREFPLHFCE